MRNPIIILGIPVDNLNLIETIDRIEQMIREGRSHGKTHQVATVNVDFVVKSIFDPELRYLLQHADLTTADGMPLVWGAKWLGTPINERVAGADLVPALAERAAKKGFSIYFLGAAPGVAARAACLLEKSYPGLQVAGVLSPPYNSVLDMDPSILDEIQAAKPDILLVAFGNPKQEKWIGMYGYQLGVPVMIGIGGSLDFIAGQTRRAPAWMQRTGLEWLFRLWQEPRRLFKRYILDIYIFCIFFLRQWLEMRRNKQSAIKLPVIELIFVQQVAVLSFQGQITVECLDLLEMYGQDALENTAHILVNMKKAEFIDTTVVGFLLELARQAHAAGGELSIASVPTTISKTLAVLKFDSFFPRYKNIDSYFVELATGKNKFGFASTTQLQIVSNPSSEVEWGILITPRVLDAQSAQELIEVGSIFLLKNPFIILDLSDTEFLVSAGLAAMAQLRRLAVQMGGEVRVANCSKDVLKVIEMVRFDQVLPLYDDIKLAVL
jgi:N-acetylglucosaminyldiphosphoundecaprenol N-acetyl-beta-D-mannosaminyltransferase